MDILSLYLRKPTHNCAILPQARVFHCFASLFDFGASALLQNHFILENTFGDKPVLNKAMAYPLWRLLTFIQTFPSILELIFTSWLKMILGTTLKVLFLCVLLLLRYLWFLFYFKWTINSNLFSLFRINSRPG